MVKVSLKRSRKKSKPMARKRSGGSRTRTVIRRVRTGGRRGLGSARGLFKSAAEGIGGAEVAGQISQMAFPQATPIARLGGAWVAGGTKGIIASIAFDAITGRSGLLGMFGIGGNGNGNGGNGGSI